MFPGQAGAARGDQSVTDAGDDPAVDTVLPFVAGIIQAGTVGDQVHLSSALVLPVAAQDVAAALIEIVLAAPLNAVVEIAAPEAVRIDAFVQD